MTGLEWKCPVLDPADPGSGGVAVQLFHGKKDMPLDIFVREDLQNRVDARRRKHEEPVRVRIDLRQLPGALIEKYFPEPYQATLKESEAQGLTNQEDRERRVRELDDLFGSDTFPVLVISQTPMMNLS